MVHAGWIRIICKKYDDLMAFKMLSTSQQVDLKSQYSTHVTKILLPCWISQDLFALGEKLGLNDIEDRYYFSGGSAREFCRDTLQEIKSNIDEAIAVAGTNIDWIFSRSPVKDGKQIDRIRRTFVMDVNNKDHYADIACFDQVIDSEYAVRCLHHRISLGHLESLFEWAHRTKNKLLSGRLFEVLVHAYGAENHFEIRVKDYAIRKRWLFWKKSFSTRAGFTLFKIREGKALCSGNTWEYQDILKNFRDDDKFLIAFLMTTVSPTSMEQRK